VNAACTWGGGGWPLLHEIVDELVLVDDAVVQIGARGVGRALVRQRLRPALARRLFGLGHFLVRVRHDVVEHRDGRDRLRADALGGGRRSPELHRVLVRRALLHLGAEGLGERLAGDGNRAEADVVLVALDLEGLEARAEQVRAGADDGRALPGPGDRRAIELALDAARRDRYDARRNCA